MNEKNETMLVHRGYWPPPTGTPPVQITVMIDNSPDADGLWGWRSEVQLGNGQTFVRGGSLEAKDADDARRRVLSRTIGFLGETMAEIMREELKHAE